MGFERVASLEELPPGQVTEAKIGAKVIALCNVEGALHAINGTCPHMGGSLGQGALHGTILVCPWHAWEFDCTDGTNLRTGRKQQRVYTARADGDDILVDAG
jgi:nitrite reductase/ring-hydroxylating ferredoxin subunit